MLIVWLAMNVPLRGIWQKKNPVLFGLEIILKTLM